jgi:hypothetical protein
VYFQLLAWKKKQHLSRRCKWKTGEGVEEMPDGCGREKNIRMHMDRWDRSKIIVVWAVMNTDIFGRRGGKNGGI